MRISSSISSTCVVAEVEVVVAVVVAHLPRPCGGVLNTARSKSADLWLPGLGNKITVASSVYVRACVCKVVTFSESADRSKRLNNTKVHLKVAG